MQHGCDISVYKCHCANNFVESLKDSRFSILAAIYHCIITSPAYATSHINWLGEMLWFSKFSMQFTRCETDLMSIRFWLRVQWTQFEHKLQINMINCSGLVFAACDEWNLQWTLHKLPLIVHVFNFPLYIIDPSSGIDRNHAILNGINWNPVFFFKLFCSVKCAHELFSITIKIERMATSSALNVRRKVGHAHNKIC